MPFHSFKLFVLRTTVQEVFYFCLFSLHSEESAMEPKSHRVLFWVRHAFQVHEK